MAPTDRRIAISLVRAAARASRMLATLAAAISSTSANAARTVLAPLRTSRPRDRQGKGRGRFHDQCGRPARLLPIDAARDQREIGPHLRGVRGVAAPPDQRQPAHVRVLLKVDLRPDHGGHRGRGKERRFRHVDAFEPGRRHAHDRDVPPVQDDLFLEDLRIGGEAGRPERVTQNHGGPASGGQLAAVKPVPTAGDTLSTSK